MDDASIRRHLSVGRLTILEIVHERPGIDKEAVVEEWVQRRPVVSDAHARRLPGTIGQLLWQLVNLEWITNSGGRLAVTPLGEYVRGFVVAKRSASPHSPTQRTGI